MLFDNTYSQLPERFYVRLDPVPVSEPGLIRVNRGLAELLGIDPAWLESEAGIETVAGNRVPDGADPIATVYAGHQFGSWNPRLGDGRAILLGEVVGDDGQRYDIQLKGSGLTPFSRNGDGRAPLGPVVREYIVSEAMHGLGIPTSRTLAAVTTGEKVYREQAFPGAVLARVAKSHIRIGTLQYFASVGDLEGLSLLVDHVIERHFADLAGADNPPLAMLERVIERQAELVASWQSIGFIHGVMNTDNMLLSGETIDYGPCAFMDYYNAAAVYSSIDHGGRYAYRNQPGIAHWNLACLAQALLPLIADDEDKAAELAQAALDRFADLFLAAYFSRLRDKLGFEQAQDGDEQLIQDFLDLLEQNGQDFTLAFRRLSELPLGGPTVLPFEFPAVFDSWLERWRERLQAEGQEAERLQQRMLATNPALIPRNHLVEAAIEQAYAGDFSKFHALTERLQRPFEDEPGDRELALPPRPEQIVQQTFCGT